MRRFLLIPALMAVAVPMLTLGGDKAVRGKRPVLGSDPRIESRAIPFNEDEPGRVRAGALRFLKGWELDSPDPAFGSFSAMLAEPEGLTLLNDAGGYVRLVLNPKGEIAGAQFGDLPGGPGGPYFKYTRDSEAMTRDPATGDIWIAFESRDAIYRYDAALRRVKSHALPPAMQRWPGNGGAEAMVRMRSGRFFVFSERGGQVPGASTALLFKGDPTAEGAEPTRFYYRPPDGYRVTDAAELPDGRLLMLHRRLAIWPFVTAKLSILDPKEVRPDEIVMGREIATLAPPNAVDNMEAMAVTREGADIIVWLASDDNFGAPFQRNLLMKFVLDPKIADKS